ncbi:hypothetical protein DPMN_050451 [Dreissena polymorpha]|uniref:Uncharacterized protein n=1 Tax=Dreissena polymorpha TaxID=45954 RepID=A0A9D4CGF0_DREPO|nr:hypothetical protein DPMN_049718 [Dreissena polymorpha]KAH3724629.1 hypothetical protein DPMN_050451 [Dreissena polymorpha]
MRQVGSFSQVDGVIVNSISQQREWNHAEQSTSTIQLTRTPVFITYFLRINKRAMCPMALT